MPQVEANGVTLEVERYGDPAAPPLIPEVAPPAPAQLASVERGVCTPERALIGSCR